MRLVRTRVLPEPGPARTLTGPRGAVTAARWDVFRFSKYLILFYVFTSEGLIAEKLEKQVKATRLTVSPEIE